MYLDSAHAAPHNSVAMTKIPAISAATIKATKMVGGAVIGLVLTKVATRGSGRGD
jgi:hypothetical protein